jgi:hypothetical protein
VLEEVIHTCTSNLYILKHVFIAQTWHQTTPYPMSTRPNSCVTFKNIHLAPTTVTKPDPVTIYRTARYVKWPCNGLTPSRQSAIIMPVPPDESDCVACLSLSCPSSITWRFLPLAHDPTTTVIAGLPVSHMWRTLSSIPVLSAMRAPCERKCTAESRLYLPCFVKKIPQYLWHPKIHYRARNRPPLFPVMSQFNP